MATPVTATPALLNTPGAELDAHNSAPMTTANAAHSILGGPGIVDPVHHVGSGFGGDNYATNTASTTAGNGVGNFIGGNVTTDAYQTVGNESFYGFGGDNFANNSASAIVGNGAYNIIGGSVIVDADQSVGNHIL